MDDADRQTISRIQYLMDGNGKPGLAVRLERLEGAQKRQATAIERLEKYAQRAQSNTDQLLGGWKSLKWVLGAAMPAVAGALWWIISTLQGITS